MRIAVTGASGNVGVRLVERLLSEPSVTGVVALARRPPADERRERVRWAAVDLGADDALTTLTSALAGVDAVVHLAWLIQPSHRPRQMERTNVTGTATLLRALAAADVGALVLASSVGAYSPGPDKTTLVDESWPTDGIPGSLYSEHKSRVERLVDAFEREHADVRVARVRPAIVLQREAGAEQARYFLGPLVPAHLLRRSLLPVVPLPDRLVTQVVHAADIADLFARAALSRDARGAYNGATEPVLDPEGFGRVLHARRVRVPEAFVRALVELSWRLRLIPTDRGWVELGLRSPLMDASRARGELGWAPAHDAASTVLEALEGVAAGAGGGTPRLAGAARPVQDLYRALRRRAA